MEEDYVMIPGSGTKKIIRDVKKEIETAFLDYSMSVIVSRALPDVRDGLKPVHRRILYTMHERGNDPSHAYRKSADTVGAVLGSYHPHGDASVYDAMVRLAQDFSLRYPLVDGQGNFGSVDGDPPAAYRYTEARMSRMAVEMLTDIDKDTIDWDPNFDETKKEPSVLPCRFPNLLVNGSQGIAVGMATNIPPHNLSEVIDGCVAYIEDPDIDLPGLMEHIKGPDFPTAGIIMGRSGIRAAYATGRGKITLRGRATIEEKKNGRAQIIVTEIPYMVNKARLIENIADLVKEKRIEGISDLNDETNRKGMRIVIDVRKDANPQVVLNQLYQYTQLQDTVGVIMLAIDHKVPKVMTLKQMIQKYVEFQDEVVRRRTQYDLKKARERAHILEGLKKATDIVDELIATIRACKGGMSEAKAAIMEQFGFDDPQADAIVKLQLGRLAGLEILKIEEELASLQAKIENWEAILADDARVLAIVKDELLEMKKRFGDERRTEIQSVTGEVDIEDLIAEEQCVYTLTEAGYIKRLPVSTYRQQKRGGKGMQGVNLKDNDYVEHLFVASTHAYMLFFSTAGKVYRLKVYELPEASRHARGTAIVNLLPLEKGESISAVIATKDFPAEEFLMFATAQGNVKKTSMDQYDRTRRDGLIAINLKDGDELISVKRVAKGEKVIMVSSAGKAILWDESEARAMGRGTMGVRGMNVPADAHVLGMEIAKPGTDLFVITEKGYGKRTKIEEYPEHHRGGQGVYTITMTHKKGLLSVMKIVGPDDEIMIVSEDGVIVRTPVKGISELGRSTQGVKVMNVADKDKVCAVAIASTGKKKAKKAAPADENQMGLLEEESEEGTLAIDDLDDLDDDLGDEGEATEE